MQKLVFVFRCRCCGCSFEQALEDVSDELTIEMVGRTNSEIDAKRFHHCDPQHQSQIGFGDLIAAKLKSIP